MAKRINLPIYVLSVAKNNHEKVKAEETLNKALALAENFELKPKTILHFDPAERIIIEVAKQREAEFIIMGKRGLKGFSKLLLGSVSEKVVASTDRGVIIVNHHWRNKMPLREDTAKEQLAYAHILDIGVKIGFILLNIGD